jgi:hypothetical protein
MISQTERDAADFAGLLVRFIALAAIRSDEEVKLAFDYLKSINCDVIERNFVLSAEAFVGQLRADT